VPPAPAPSSVTRFLHDRHHHLFGTAVEQAGFVKPSAPAGKLGRTGQVNASSTQASQPVSLLQLIAERDAAGDDVRALSAQFPKRRRPAVEHGIGICNERVRLWWNRFGPMFAGEVRCKRVSRMHGFRHRHWHLDEMYVKLNGGMMYLWRAGDQEGEVLGSFATKAQDKQEALTFMKKALKRHGSAEAITTDRLRSYGAAMNELGNRIRMKSAVGPTTGEELGFAVSPTRAGNAQVQADEDLTEVRLCSRQHPQPFQPGTPSN
jgi:hypothetical protein